MYRAEQKGWIVVGIDPQETLLAVHIRSQWGTSVDWFEQRLRKKNSFERVLLWQAHIVEQSNLLLEKIKRDYPLTDIYLAIEQQRGRCRSIIEQSLLSACFYHHVSCVIYHPNTWRAGVGLTNQGSNYQNKKSSTTRCLAELNVFFAEKGLKVPVRKHDLCEAFLISQYAYAEVLRRKELKLSRATTSMDVDDD